MAESFEVIKDGNKIIAYQKTEFDYEKLKLFFLSVLWRAGVSNSEFFEQVKLGPHEIILRKMILERDPGEKEKYSVHLFRFLDLPDGIPILIPIRARNNYGYWYYRIYLGRFFYDITVDKRRMPIRYREGIVQRDRPLFACARDIKGMSEYKILMQIVNAPHNAID